VLCLAQLHFHRSKDGAILDELSVAQRAGNIACHGSSFLQSRILGAKGRSQSQYVPSALHQISLAVFLELKQNKYLRIFYLGSLITVVSFGCIPAQNGGTPLTNMYSMTPAVHTSASGP